MIPFKELNKLITKSNSLPIVIGEIEYSFQCIKKYSEDELNLWEKKHIKLPDEYKNFLINVGACKIYIDDCNIGIIFHTLDYIEEFTKEVYKGLRSPFPHLLLIASNLNNGDIIGYNLKKVSDSNLSVYSIEEEYPEKWIEIEEFITLEVFIEKLIKSNGEDYYL